LAVEDLPDTSHYTLCNQL